MSDENVVKKLGLYSERDISSVGCDKCGYHLGWRADIEYGGSSIYCDSCMDDLRSSGSDIE